MRSWLAPVAKAALSGLVTFLGSTISALSSDQSLGDLTARTWLSIALATVISAGGVYGISNRGSGGTG